SGVSASRRAIFPPCCGPSRSIGLHTEILEQRARTQRQAERENQPRGLEAARRANSSGHVVSCRKDLPRRSKSAQLQRLQQRQPESLSWSANHPPHPSSRANLWSVHSSHHLVGDCACGTYLDQRGDSRNVSRVF